MKKTVLRSVDQNKLMWQRLTDWSRQETRYTLGGERLDAWDFKELLMAAFKREVRLTRPLEGKGVVYLSRSTSRLTKEQFAEFLEFIAAEGAKRGIVFKDTPPNPLGAPPGPITVKIVPPVPRNEDELRAALKASCALEDKS